MKDKKQNQLAVEDSEHDEKSSQQGNGKNGTINTQLTDGDKQKGNLKNFNISKKTIKKLKARNVEFLFPVQSGSYTSIHEQNDCLIQASNGSGKTLAFVIPLVELLQSDKSVELTAGRAPRVLVVTPTRDAAKQISDDFQSVVNDLSVATIYTTKKKSDDQETALTNGCDILVATPDRLKEFIDEEKVDVSQMKHVVLDGVDELVDDLKKVLKNVFGSDQETKAQLIVFSETIPDSLRKAIKKYLAAEAVTLDLTAQKTTKDNDDNNNDDDDDEDAEESANTSSANASGAADNSSRSVLSKQPNYTTYKLSTNDEIKGVGFVFTMLRKCFGDDFDAKGNVPQIAFTKDFTTAIFDLPSEYDEQLQNNWKDSPRIQMGPITQLPELDEASMNDHNQFTRGNNRSGGGGGDRNAGRSNTCFNCQKEGHKSWECPDGNSGQSQRNGGNKSGGGGCFNCGKDGHRSFECTEPKKAGGRSGGGASGGGGGSGCFNCGKEGHRSFECPEPKKAGGRSGGGGAGGGSGCFNCGKDGHRSFECPEPKKAGGRSGGGGGGGGGGGCFNCGKEGHRSFECTEPKKAGGREQSNACFNCGKDGHKSFDCPEPKKGRPSFGGGDRGGGRGGARGGAKRSFGGGYENGHNAGEASNKKIKFDDDE